MSTTADKQTLEAILTTELGLDILSEDKKQEMLDKIAPLIMQTAIVRAIAELPDEEVLNFDTMMNANPKPEEVMVFMKARGIDMDRIISEEIKIFQKESEPNPEIDVKVEK